MTRPGYQDSILFHPQPDTTIGAIYASARVEGTVSFSGTITRLDRRHSGRGDAWVELTVTDESTETLPVLVFPKTYDLVHQHLAEQADVRITGLLNRASNRLEIIARNIQPT